MGKLSNRQQRLKSNRVRSDNLNNNRGVPHGSVLGPLLFFICLNDITDIVGECRILLFADDALLYFTDYNLYIGLDVVNTTLERLYKY